MIVIIFIIKHNKKNIKKKNIKEKTYKILIKILMKKKLLHLISLNLKTKSSKNKFKYVNNISNNDSLKKIYDK